MPIGGKKIKERLLVLKKVLLIILCLAQVVAIYAVSYASPYKGAGRNGGIYLTSSANHSTTEGIAQTPVIAMSSVSSGVRASSSQRGIAAGRMTTGSVMMGTVAPMRGIYTSATSVTGGVTTYSHPHPGSVRKGPDTPGEVDSDTPPECGCHWELVGDKYVCPICGVGAEMFEKQ